MLEFSTRRSKEHARTKKVNNYKNILIMTNYSLYCSTDRTKDN